MPDQPAIRLQDIKAALAQRGLSPQKKFGQNFMADPNFAAAVSRDAQIDSNTLVLEIGPGTGCLTHALLHSREDARVLAVEIDRGLAALLRETFASYIGAGKLTLVEGDALDGKHRLADAWVEKIREIARTEGRTRIVLCANLPYNAATPLLANLALGAQDLDVMRAVATIQYELAERLFATEKDNSYGALSALLALRTRGSILRKVGGDIFWPRPQVDSAVIAMDFIPWADAPLKRPEAPAFQEFLQKLFSQRRKMLRAALKPAKLPPAWEERGSMRAEELSPEALLDLFRSCKGI